MKEKITKCLIEYQLRSALAAIYEADFEADVAYRVFKKRNIATPRNNDFLGVQLLIHEYIKMLSDCLSCDMGNIYSLAQSYALHMDIDGEIPESFEEEILHAVDRMYRNQTECDDE